MTTKLFLIRSIFWPIFPLGMYLKRVWVSSISDFTPVCLNRVNGNNLRVAFLENSRDEWKENKFHFSFLEKSESISDFTLFLEKKEWIMHVLSWKIQKIWSPITQKCNNFIMVILFLKTILAIVMITTKIQQWSDCHRLQLTG